MPTVDGVASLVPLGTSMLVWKPDGEEVSPAPAESALQKLGIRWANMLDITTVCLPGDNSPNDNASLVLVCIALWATWKPENGRSHCLCFCRFVSSTDGPSHPKLHLHLHPGNGRGFLAALLSLRCASWPEHFAGRGVTAEERRALCSVFLQVKRLAAVKTPILMLVLKCVCIIFRCPGNDKLGMKQGRPAVKLFLWLPAWDCLLLLPAIAMCLVSGLSRSADSQCLTMRAYVSLTTDS